MSPLATIIRQLIKSYTTFDLYVYPFLGYSASLFSVVSGILLSRIGNIYYAPGHVIVGLGLITLYVSTVAKASSKFTLIPKNSTSTNNRINNKAFNPGLTKLYDAIPIICAVVRWSINITRLSQSSKVSHLVAGSMVGGISAICTDRIVLVASIVRQESNRCTQVEKKVWNLLILIINSAIFDMGAHLHLYVCRPTPYIFLDGY